MKIEQFETIVPAPLGKQKRKVYVYLPQKYDGKKRFPVLYILLMDKRSSLMKQLLTAIVGEWEKL